MTQEKKKKTDEIKIDIEIEIVGDPKIPIYKITIEKNRGTWEETLGSKEIAEAFLQGLRAAFSFTEVGFITVPSIKEAGL